MDISGYVVLGIVTLFLVYLMPQLIRGRQDVVDSRLADRFSADLRILATAGTTGGGSRPAADDGAPRAYLHDPRLRTEVSAMNRPITRVAQTVTSDSVNPGEKRKSNSRPMPALAHRPPASVAGPGRGPQTGQRTTGGATSTRSAVRSGAALRRRAAARRRLMLTLVLLALSAGAWVAFAVGAAHVGLAAAPTALLVLVLVLGRRAAAASARAERTARNAARRPAHPVAVAPKSSRPAPSASRGSARPASRPAGRDARAAHAGTTQVLAAQRHNVNAQRAGAQNGAGQPAAQAPMAPAVGTQPAAVTAATGSTDSAGSGSATAASGRAGESMRAVEFVRPGAVRAGSVRASREAGTELIPRVRVTATPAAQDVADDQASEGTLGEGSGEPAATLVSDAPALAAEVEAAAPAVEARGSAAHDDAARSWTPVPVPVPTYTLKPTAPRLSPPELSAAEGGPQPAEAVAAGSAEQEEGVAEAAGARGADAPTQAPAASADEAPQAPIEEPSEAALDLDAVLSRRRASGE